MAATVWDEGDAYYPPTGLQISNISAGTGASNVIPGHADVQFNFRFNTQHTAEQLQQQVEALLDRHGLDYEITWRLSGNPFLTEEGQLTRIVRDAVAEVTGVDCEMSTAGGTSDGRFIAPMGCDVVELGPINASIHKVDEHVAIADLEPLARIYQHILRALG